MRPRTTQNNPQSAQNGPESRKMAQHSADRPRTGSESPRTAQTIPNGLERLRTGQARKNQDRPREPGKARKQLEKPSEAQEKHKRYPQKPQGGLDTSMYAAAVMAQPLESAAAFRCIRRAGGTKSCRRNLTVLKIKPSGKPDGDEGTLPLTPSHHREPKRPGENLTTVTYF